MKNLIQQVKYLKYKLFLQLGIKDKPVQTEQKAAKEVKHDHSHTKPEEEQPGHVHTDPHHHHHHHGH